jgi:hypothetical protein
MAESADADLDVARGGNIRQAVELSPGKAGAGDPIRRHLAESGRRSSCSASPSHLWNSALSERRWR